MLVEVSDTAQSCNPRSVKDALQGFQNQQVPYADPYVTLVRREVGGVQALMLPEAVRTLHLLLSMGKKVVPFRLVLRLCSLSFAWRMAWLVTHVCQARDECNVGCILPATASCV